MGWSRSDEVRESEAMMAKFDKNGMDDSSVEALTWEDTEKVLDGQTIEIVPNNATINETVDEVSTSEKEVKKGERFEGKCEVGGKPSFCKEQEDLEEMVADEVKQESEDMESFENVAKTLETRENPDDCEKSEDETLNDEWSSMEISTDSSGASPDHSTGVYCIECLNIIYLNI